MEKPFDPRALLVDIFDYSRCQRPDGSYYGTAGVCRKGAPVSDADFAQAIKVRNKKVEDGKSIAALSEAAKTDAVTGVELPSKSKVEEYKGKILDRRKELEEKIEKGEDISKELKNFIENRTFMGDPLTSPVIVVGMEEGVPSDLEKSMGYKGILATTMAKSELKLANPDDSRAIDFAVPTVGDKNPPFYTHHAKALSELTGQTYSPSDASRPNGAVAQLELRSIPAKGKGTWDISKEPLMQNSANVKALGGRDRKDYQAKHDKKMESSLRRNITTAVEKNPNLKTVVMAVGKTDPAESAAAQGIMHDLSKAPGAKGRQFDYEISQGGKVTKATGSIVDVKGNGQTFVYNYGLSVSGQGVQATASTRAIGRKMLEEEMKLRSGQSTPISKPGSTTKTPKAPKASVPKTTSPSSRNNKSALTARAKPTLTQSQKNERKSRIQDLLNQAKKDRNSGSIRQFEKMLADL